jgi:phage terminase large subunit-like protein
MEAQWLPVNLAKGFIKDVTRQYGGAATRRVTKVLDEATWRRPAARSLALDEASQPRGEFALEVVPAAHVLAALEKAPSGLVVVVVRADKPALVTRVSHVGVLVRGPRGLMLRHASRSYKKVVDEPLAHYLTRNLDFASWTIEGLALFEPLEPPLLPLAPEAAPDAGQE